MACRWKCANRPVLMLLLAATLACAPGAGAASRRASADALPEGAASRPGPIAVALKSSADGVRLAGDLYPAMSGSPGPGVLLLGPTGPDDRNLQFGRLEPFRALAEALQARGITVLTLDDRGVGGSGGDWRLADHATLAADALSALEWLARRAPVDDARVGLFGLSEGSAIALLAAAKDPGMVSFAVLGSPPGLSGEASLRQQFETAVAQAGLAGTALNDARSAFEAFLSLTRRAAEDDAALPALESFLAGPGRALVPPYRFVPSDPAGQATLFSSPWYQSQLDWNPAAVGVPAAVPLLIIGGDLDPVLPPALHHPALAAHLSGAQVQFQVLTGANHLLMPARTGSPAEYREIQEPVHPAVVPRVVSWLISVGVFHPRRIRKRARTTVSSAASRRAVASVRTGNPVRAPQNYPSPHTAGFG